LEQFEPAADSLEKATRLNPNDSSALLLLGAAYGHLGRKQEAVAAIAAYDALGRPRGKPPITATFDGALGSTLNELTVTGFLTV
jgi:tetratricopeptide (TPR) repeat protein